MYVFDKSILFQKFGENLLQEMKSVLILLKQSLQVEKMRNIPRKVKKNTSTRKVKKITNTRKVKRAKKVRKVKRKRREKVILLLHHLLKIVKMNGLKRSLSPGLGVGMISHKKSLKTIFGQKHEIKNFIKKFDIFHEKFQRPLNFGFGI